MLFNSTIVNAASGSMGGITASNNRGGLYFKGRTNPVNPQTPAQIAIRVILRILVDRWTNDLTQVLRDGWDVYAANVPLVGRLGLLRNVTGQNMYIRSNMSRVQGGVVVSDVAPAIFDLGSFTETTIAAAETGSFLSLSFLDTDAWANEDGAAMLIYGSRPQNPSINFFKGPFRFLGKVDGDAILAPTSPETIASPFTYTIGQKVFARVVVVRADGRTSEDQISSIIVTA